MTKADQFKHLEKSWRWERMDCIEWLNEPQKATEQLALLDFNTLDKYGESEPPVVRKYHSCPVMLVEVPSIMKRKIVIDENLMLVVMEQP